MVWGHMGSKPDVVLLQLLCGGVGCDGCVSTVAVAATCGEYEGCVVGVAAVECGVSSDDASGECISF
jgi:hypothetical protein